jgi:hypothetical protein
MQSQYFNLLIDTSDRKKIGFSYHQYPSSICFIIYFIYFLTILIKKFFLYNKYFTLRKNIVFKSNISCTRNM